jgi:DNA-binding response OmpR family regulator
MVTMEGKLLIVDDQVGESLGEFFTKEGYQTKVILDGAEVMDAVDEWEPDVVILDVMLPHIDGRELCRQIRARYNMSVGIIMISEYRVKPTDRIVGFELGADNYLIKPFETDELLAQVRAVLRRLKSERQTGDDAGRFIVDDYLSIHYENREVLVDGKRVKLTAKEFNLLAFFVKNPGKAFSRTELIDKFWPYEIHSEADDRAVNVCIARLRKKIEPDHENPKYIIGVHGIGYKFQKLQD